MAEGKVRSIRIQGDVLDRADAEAARRGLTFNSWVSMLMADALNGEVWVAVKRKAENTPDRFAARPEPAQAAAVPPAQVEEVRNVVDAALATSPKPKRGTRAWRAARGLA